MEKNVTQNSKFLKKILPRSATIESPRIVYSPMFIISNKINELIFYWYLHLQFDHKKTITQITAL